MAEQNILLPIQWYDDDTQPCLWQGNCISKINISSKRSGNGLAARLVGNVAKVFNIFQLVAVFRGVSDFQESFFAADSDNAPVWGGRRDGLTWMVEIPGRRVSNGIQSSRIHYWETSAILLFETSCQHSWGRYIAFLGTISVLTFKSSPSSLELL